MKQLLNNLISNAIKFRQQGITTKVQVVAQEVVPEEKETMNLGGSESWYKISISDNGIGFEQMYANKIFQIFQRLHGKTDYPGSGIGLAICKKIVDNHKGFISAKSVLTEGATFTIYLPSKQ
ncbi:MAG: hypothetical protein JWQ96_3097 [Segetibacter sp.]|jgi:signal transduction histidine kinase|nr:hypothetical protein [Segetibacter sp.]